MDGATYCNQVYEELMCAEALAPKRFSSLLGPTLNARGLASMVLSQDIVSTPRA